MPRNITEPLFASICDQSNGIATRTPPRLFSRLAITTGTNCPILAGSCIESNPKRGEDRWLLVVGVPLFLVVVILDCCRAGNSSEDSSDTPTEIAKLTSTGTNGPHTGPSAAAGRSTDSLNVIAFHSRYASSDTPRI